MGFWVAVAVQTPSHRLILVLMDHFHLVDPSVARNARNATVDVGSVVEVNVVGKAMDAYPVD